MLHAAWRRRKQLQVQASSLICCYVWQMPLRCGSQKIILHPIFDATALLDGFRLQFQGCLSMCTRSSASPAGQRPTIYIFILERQLSPWRWPQCASASRRRPHSPRHGILLAHNSYAWQSLFKHLYLTLQYLVAPLQLSKGVTHPQVFGKAYVYAPVMRLPAVIVLSIVLTGMLVLAHHAFELDKEQPASDAVQYERVV